MEQRAWKRLYLEGKDSDNLLKLASSPIPDPELRGFAPPGQEETLSKIGPALPPMKICDQRNGKKDSMMEGYGARGFIMTIDRNATWT